MKVLYSIREGLALELVNMRNGYSLHYDVRCHPSPCKRWISLRFEIPNRVIIGPKRR